MENNTSTTPQKSSPKWPLIAGIVGAVVLLAAIIIFVLLQPKKDSQTSVNNGQSTVNDVAKYNDERDAAAENDPALRDLVRSQHLSALRVFIATKTLRGEPLPAFGEINLDEVRASGDRKLEDPSTKKAYKFIEGVSTSTDTIGYVAGEDCSGEKDPANYKVTLKKEDGSLACLPS